MDDCIFCKIAAGKIPVPKLAESPEAVAFADINPQAPFHALVIPRAHIASLKELTDFGVVARLYELGAQIAKANGIDQSGYRTVINTGPDAGQTVFHVHLHVMGGRHMAWPPG